MKREARTTKLRKARQPRLSRVVVEGKVLYLKPHALRFWRLTQRLKASA